MISEFTSIFTVLLMLMSPIICLVYSRLIVKLIYSNKNIPTSDKNYSIVGGLFILFIYLLLLFFALGFVPKESCSYGDVCDVNIKDATFTLLIMELIIIIHHYLTLDCIYRVVKSPRGIGRYIFMYIYMLILFIFCFILIIATGFYDNIIDILRLIVFLSPIFLFMISSNGKNE